MKRDVSKRKNNEFHNQINNFILFQMAVISLNEQLHVTLFSVCVCVYRWMWLKDGNFLQIL